VTTSQPHPAIGCSARKPEKRGQFRPLATLATLGVKAWISLTVTVGLAQLQIGESNDDVIARADADLYQQRHQRSH